MQIKEAFKLGFLARCVEEGLTPNQTHALAKRAADGEVAPLSWLTRQITAPIKDVADTSRSVTEAVKSHIPLLALGAAIPPALGGAAAYLAHNATDADATDVKQVSQQELTDTYRRMAEQLQRTKKMRNYKQQRKRTGQIFL